MNYVLLCFYDFFFLLGHFCYLGLCFDGIGFVGVFGFDFTEFRERKERESQ